MKESAKVQANRKLLETEKQELSDMVQVDLKSGAKATVNVCETINKC
jgi:hypothetical protein